MNSRGFADRSPLKGPIYCDASYILDLYTYAHKAPSFAGIKPWLKARCLAAHGFYIWARVERVEFVTSFLALQECYHRFVFSEIKDEVQRRGLRSWKDLKRDDQAEYNRLLARGRQHVGDFHTFFRGSGVSVMAFGSGALSQMLLREPRIARYARGILATCHVDTMDAFHYAIMRRAGIDVAASGDRDWHALPYGTIVSN